MLAERNAHPKDAYITFDEEPHIYYIHGDCEGWCSVTTFVHGFFAEFNPYWAAKAMVRSAKFPHNKKYEQYRQFVYDKDGRRRNDEQIVKDIQKQWDSVGGAARTLGTYLHKAIEDYYNEAPLPDPLPSEWEYFQSFDIE